MSESFLNISDYFSKYSNCEVLYKKSYIYAKTYKTNKFSCCNFPFAISNNYNYMHQCCNVSHAAKHRKHKNNFHKINKYYVKLLSPVKKNTQFHFVDVSVYFEYYFNLWNNTA